MNDVLEESPVDGNAAPTAAHILDIARTRLESTEGAYAGAVTPPEAWQLYQDGCARLVDVRTAAEVHYVGRVPGARHVEWQGTDAEKVERFVRDLKATAEHCDTLLLLCCNGVRSHHAARVAQQAGYVNAYNVLEGFEGQRNHAHQRGFIDGWRSHGLPWIQD